MRTSLPSFQIALMIYCIIADHLLRRRLSIRLFLHPQKILNCKVIHSLMLPGHVEHDDHKSRYLPQIETIEGGRANKTKFLFFTPHRRYRNISQFMVQALVGRYIQQRFDLVICDSAKR